MRKKKKICCVLPSLQAGGMERVMSELASFIACTSNAEVHVITMVKSNVFYSLSKKVLFHEPSFLFSSGNRIVNQLRTILFLRKKIKEIKPNAVLSFGETYNSFVLLSTFGLKLKVFVSDRSKPDKKWGYFHEYLRKNLYPKAYGIISQTNYSKSFLHAETKHNNIRVIPNPVDISKFSDHSREDIVLYVGRLISTKRIGYLIEIFLKINNPDYQLWIVGDGPLRVSLEEKVVNLGVSDRVKLWGNQRNVEEFYSKAKIFAFSSISEGFPNALLEALAAGLPSISSNCVAGPSDLIEDGVNGFLIPVDDKIQFQQKLDELMNNNELRTKMGAKAKESASQYEISIIANEYLNFLLS